jgi:DNA-binding transcriptional LysR family regulator
VQVELFSEPIVSADLWHGLEVRHLAALRAVAEQGTFAAAAAQLGYTQSAISQQIAALEKIVGARLLVRTSGRRPVGVTDAGALLLRHGESILARVQATQADLAILQEGAAGPLRIGTYPSVGARVLPELLPAFAAQMPAVQIQLHESNSDSELLTQIEQGRLDLAFCMLPVEEGPFEALELLRDPWVLVVPAESVVRANGRPCATLGPVEPLLSFRTCPTLREIESILDRWEVQPSHVFRSDDNATLQSLVGAGTGIAFMTCLTVEPGDPRTAFADVRSELAPRRIGIAWHLDRYSRPAPQTFIRSAARVARRLQRKIDAVALVGIRTPAWLCDASL